MARVKQELVDEAYQSYVGENLRIIGENTAKLGGSYMTKKWYDVAHPKPVETRSADEIIAHMKQKISGCKTGGGGGRK